MSMRFSMQALWIVVTLLAVGLAAMASHSRFAVSAVYTLTWLLLCLSLAAAIGTQQEARRFWLGFAVFGWCYWLMIGDWSLDSNGSVMRSNLVLYGRMPYKAPPSRSDHFLSTYVIDFLETQVGGGLSVGDAVSAQYMGGGYYPGVVDEVKDGQYLIRWTDGSSSPAQWTRRAAIANDSTQFRVAAHCVACAVWGLLGGILSMMVCSVRKREEIDKVEAG